MHGAAVMANHNPRNMEEIDQIPERRFSGHVNVAVVLDVAGGIAFAETDDHHKNVRKRQ